MALLDSAPATTNCTVGVPLKAYSRLGIVLIAAGLDALALVELGVLTLLGLRNGQRPGHRSKRARRARETRAWHKRRACVRA